jgi:hypothetical protein
VQFRIRIIPATLPCATNSLARKRLTPDSRIAELEHDLDAAKHLLHEIVIAAFRREHGRDPATRAEYRAYHHKLYEDAIAAMEARSGDVPEWLTTDDE